MYQINDKLAVHGLDWDWDKMKEINTHNHEYNPTNYGVITDPKFDMTGKKLDDWVIVDCRTLLDDWVNPTEKYKDLIDVGKMILCNNYKVVCCCSAGQSRSNAIALGILVDFFEMNFYDAWDLIREKNPLCNIAMHHLDVLKHMYKVKLP